MAELGYDLSAHDSKSLDNVKDYAPFDAVVTMGAYGPVVSVVVVVRGSHWADAFLPRTYPTDRPTYTPMPNDAHAGCGDACPWMPAKHHIDWTIPDPKHMEPEEFNKASGERDDAM